MFGFFFATSHPLHILTRTRLNKYEVLRFFFSKVFLFYFTYEFTYISFFFMNLYKKLCHDISVTI